MCFKVRNIFVSGLCLLLLRFANAGKFNCNFDIDSCGWTQDLRDSFDWTRNTGGTNSSKTGPSTDHTTGHGYYMYIETSSHSPGHTARLISPAIDITNQMCLVFYYHMYGSHINALSVYLSRSRSLGSAMWTESGSQGNAWQRATVPIYGLSITASVTNIVFEGVQGSGYRGDIAIDDVSLTFGRCHAGEINCTFDTDACGWTEDQRDTLNWTRTTGSTYPLRAGPHGYCMNIRSSSYIRGQNVRLTSPTINGINQMCLVFYYYMWGRSTNALNVYISRSGSFGIPIWTKRQTLGNEWKRVQITCGSTNTAVTNIVFEGVLPTYYFGGIAIDDVSLTRGNCYAGEFNCTFDGGVCGWAPDWTGDFAWTRYSGGTPSDHTGPYSDHTSGHGYYMFIETSSFKHGQKARLISPSVTSAVPMCLDFYYHMCALHGNALNIYVYRNGSLGNIIWTGSSTQGNVWKRARILIDGGSTNKGITNIVFEGVTGWLSRRYRRDIAFDDVILVAGSCDHVPATIRTNTVAVVLGIVAVVIVAVLIVLVVYLSWKLHSVSARDLWKRNSEEMRTVSNPLYGQIDGNTVF